MLVCSHGKFKDFLSLHVPVLQEEYWPTLWCYESRLQTVLSNMIRSVYPRVKYHREILKLNDGGEVALDWFQDGCPASAPIVIILPGLVGNSQSQYIRCLVLSANRMKLRTVVFNNRGCGGISLKTLRTYNPANFEDLTDVVTHVKSLNPGIPVAATGVSMGGLELGIVPELWSMEDVLKSKTIRELDTAYTAKQFGYEDVNSYYADASMHDKLHKIEIPMLCLSARDDLFQPYEAIPVEEARKSKYVAIVITERGGHVGFLEGILPVFHEEYICRLFTQYFTGVFTSGSEHLASMNCDQ